TCRVLKPGAVIAGSDSRTSFRFRLFHVMDTCVPIDASSFGERLVAAGFTEPYIGVNEYSVWFRARKPA
ncbi:MAG: SAM-dependent methyltransferase, partial [Dehalococcoidia bacterium]